jgi:serine/threonine protein kinase
MGICLAKPPPPNPYEIDLSHFDVLKVVGKGGFGKVNAISPVVDSPIYKELLESNAASSSSKHSSDSNESINCGAQAPLLALKRMEKNVVLQSSSHLKIVWLERKIMSFLENSPFCCSLLYAFENPCELFLVMPFMPGGDLRYYLREQGEC